MKHCRKMKLVDCNDNTSSITDVSHHVEDEFLKNPHLLSNLDVEMKKIIERNNIPDYDKWIMYNEVLRRYLFFC